MLSEKEKLENLTYLGVDLNQIQDLDILMELILTKARQFVNADAGSIYIREGGFLNFNYTQNDTLQHRLSPGEKLIYSIFSIPIDETSIAGHVALTGQPLNIQDVYTIDATLPYGFNDKFDRASNYETRSMLALPLKNINGDILGVLQVINAQDDEKHIIPFTEEDQKMMMLFASIAAVALERAQMIRTMILRMIKMAELRDPKETGAHVNRVGGYSLELYERWAHKHGVSRQEIDKNRDILRMAAMLHDVGKVGISDLLLKKPERFNNDEYEIMKQHTVLGAQLFLNRQSDFDEASAQVALNHHEKWDGSGYPGFVDIETMKPLPEHALPNGKARPKKGEDIPLFGRIVALADVYDALSSARVYKPAWDENKVLSTIEEEAGRHFDPELVEIFFSSLEALKIIQQRYKDKGKESGS